MNHVDDKGWGALLNVATDPAAEPVASYESSPVTPVTAPNTTPAKSAIRPRKKAAARQRAGVSSRSRCEFVVTIDDTSAEGIEWIAAARGVSTETVLATALTRILNQAIAMRAEITAELAERERELVKTRFPE